MLSYIVVMLGGALGTGARFWASGLIAERAGEFFPLGTLIVNITGSFAIGFVAAFTDPEGRFLLSPRFREFLGSAYAAVTRPFHRSAYKRSTSYGMETGSRPA